MCSPGPATNSAQHEIVNVLKHSEIFFYLFSVSFFVSQLHSSQVRLLELTQCHNVRRLESVIRRISVHMCHVLLIN